MHLSTNVIAISHCWEFGFFPWHYKEQQKNRQSLMCLSITSLSVLIAASNKWGKSLHLVLITYLPLVRLARGYNCSSAQLWKITCVIISKGARVADLEPSYYCEFRGKNKWIKMATSLVHVCETTHHTQLLTPVMRCRGPFVYDR